MTLFFIGILEMLIVTAWTKLVSNTKIFASGFITIVNILIWYYVLRVVVDDIDNWQLILLYAFGCALGTVISTYLFHLQEKKKASKT